MQNSDPSTRPGAALNATTLPQPKALLTGMAASIAVGIVMGKLTRGPLKKQVQAFDTRLIKATRKAQKFHLDPVMNLLSDLGENPPLYGISGLLAAARLLQHDAGESTMLGLAVAGSAAVNHAIKAAVNRPRPYLRLPLPQSRPSASSFPSNHALMSMVTYGAVAYLINCRHGNKPPALLAKGENNDQSRISNTVAENAAPGNNGGKEPEGADTATHRSSWRKTVACVVLPVMLCFMIGWSRVYRGVHNPSDVLAGWIVGGIWLLSCTWHGSQNHG